MKQSFISLSILVALSVTSVTALAANEETAEGTSGKVEQKVPWRGSAFTYENTFSAFSLNKGADQTYNPYYGMAFDFKPRFYIRDDLSLRLRLIMDTELTVPDSDYRRFTISDTYLDVVYAPDFMTIPYAKIKVSPSLRFMFPSSIVSQGKSMVMNIGPGISFLREIPLLKGRFLKSLTLTYGFRGLKEFYRYATAQVQARQGCSNLNRPECLHSGDQNRSWRLINVFDTKLQILEKLSFSFTLFLFNDLLHQLPAETRELEGAGTIELSESSVNHRASTWAIFDVSYDLLEWLSLSVGTSTFYAQLAPNSDYRTPLFNRATNFYFDVTIPVDAFISQVQTWGGWK